MSDLAQKHCIPCTAGTPPLTGQEIAKYVYELADSWQVVDNHHLQREFDFKDFREALAFTNRIGELAEAEGHHPDIFTSWGRVGVTIFTHKIDGLSESDFILAAKIDKMPQH